MNVKKFQNGFVFKNLTDVQERKLVDFLAKDLVKPEKILPRPVIRDKNDKLIADYSIRDWFLKVQEEIFEVQEEFFETGFCDHCTAEEIADVITVCISWLESLGYDEEERSELFAAVNEKNKVRGYFDEN